MGPPSGEFRRIDSRRTSGSPVDLLAFFADRLKVQLREQGARHDLVDAVFALGQGATGGSGGVTAPRWADGNDPLLPPSFAATSPQGGGGRPPVTRRPSPEGPADARVQNAPDPHPVGSADRPPPFRGRGSAPAAPAVQDDLLLIVRRVEALGKFLDTEDGRNLLAGYKRATNILREEEKKSGERYRWRGRSDTR